MTTWLKLLGSQAARKTRGFATSHTFYYAPKSKKGNLDSLGLSRPSYKPWNLWLAELHSNTPSRRGRRIKAKDKNLMKISIYCNSVLKHMWKSSSQASDTLTSQGTKGPMARILGPGPDACVANVWNQSLRLTLHEKCNKLTTSFDFAFGLN